MKVQVIICIALSLLGTALTGPPADNFNGMVDQNVESEDYFAMSRQDTESEEYDPMIQQLTATEQQNWAQTQATYIGHLSE